MSKIQPIPQKKRAAKAAATRQVDLPQKSNYVILIAGVVVILLGYVVMAAGDATSPLSVTVAPIILILGYCVLVPLGIIYRKKSPDQQKSL
ncbi:MAG: DUF3098 domain-containing protein [Ignavibacteria bacterium]|nr:DUF3098 domain-containing protein [Ignavibacteria bacterium]